MTDRGARLLALTGAAALLALAVAPGLRAVHAASPSQQPAPVAVGDPSPVVYPPPTLPLAFDHARHAQRGIACQRCHAAAAQSLSAKDSLLPPESSCRSTTCQWSPAEPATTSGSPAIRSSGFRPKRETLIPFDLVDRQSPITFP